MSNTFSEKSVVVRYVQRSDAEAMLGIYRPYVEKGAITFEIEVPTVDDFAGRIDEIVREAPFLAAIADNRVVGYAYASKHRARAAYQWAVEVSVYVDANYHRQGVAKKLYTQLLRMLQEQGYVIALAGITLPNDRSVCFHEALGFTYFATYKKIGFKQGEWHDVGWWERILNPFSVPPPPLKIPSAINSLVGGEG